MLAYAVVLYIFVRANTGGDSAGSAGSTGSVNSIGAEPTSPPTVAQGPGALTSGSTLTPEIPPPGGSVPASATGAVTASGQSPHQILLRVTSAGPIARLGYLIPTSPDHSSADMRDVRSPWTLRTIAYGNSGYAEVFIQTDSSGTPITCSITVDGKVTSMRTTSGVYGRQVCEG